MQVATGIKILDGIAIGKIRIVKTPEYAVSESTADDPDRELGRFEEARTRCRALQHALYAKAAEAAGEDTAAIFRVRADMLDDAVLTDAVRTLIAGQQKTAEYAVREGFGSIARMFMEMEDSYLRERSADIIDVRNSMLEILLGIDTTDPETPEPSILVAEDLAPSETVKLDRSLVLGIITREGSTGSHTAILARSMNLPALIQCREIQDDWDGKLAILDGYNACVYIDPTPELVETMTARYNEDKKKAALLQELKGKPSTTLDGHTVHLYANISSPQDIAAAKANDAEGVGLFRSEFVYLGSREEPSEEEQFQAYRKVLETFAPRLTIIRTCDIGADKTAGYMDLEREDNPAMGFRAVRICLTRKDFFKKQLRALLRASAYGSLGIMFPMIASVWEVKECRRLLEECMQELEDEQIPFSKEIQVGIMVETPAAVLCADELAEEVDFFSLGTNDLTQYLLAADRQNAKLERFCDTHHPAVMRAVRMTVEAGHRHGTWVGICGELGADQTMTETFLRMGIDELSVNPGSILPLRKVIRSMDLSKDE